MSGEVRDKNYNGKTLEMESPGETDADAIGLTSQADHEAHNIFSEMDELDLDEEEWVERTRWIVYEQNYEEEADRWSNPHVSSLSFHSVVVLRKCIEFGTVILDAAEEVLPEIAVKITDQLIEDMQIDEYSRNPLIWALKLRHRHMRPESVLPTLHGIRKSKVKTQPHHDDSMDALERLSHSNMIEDEESGHINSGRNSAAASARARKNWAAVRHNLDRITGHTTSFDFSHLVSDVIELMHAQKFMRRFPTASETGSVMVGVANFVKHPVAAFVRLSKAHDMGIQLAEVPLPVRFIFLYLIPPDHKRDHLDVGRTMATLLSNPKFKYCAYESMCKQEILEGIDQLMDDSLVIPTGQPWENETFLPIVNRLMKREKEVRRAEETASLRRKSEVAAITEPAKVVNPLIRTGRIFGGLINDVKRRYPKYLSDIKDACNTQCLGAILFIYFAALSPAITFGGLLSEKTEKWIGVSETLIMTAIGGLIFSFLSGQPLVILGVTGPTLVFEESLYQVCSSFDLEYLSFHFWVGVWLAVIISLFVAAEGPVLVRYVSRFTQDIFALLISLIFIFESFKKMYMVFKRHPLEEYYPFPTTTISVPLPVNVTGPTTPSPDEEITDQPNTALLSLILTLGTFAIASYLKTFKTSHYLGKTARKIIGDFSIPIAILVMVLVDFLIKDTYTEKLDVPDGLSPTDSEKRGWFVNPMGMEKDLPVWAIPLAIVPAFIIFILIFMEAQITSLIVNQKLIKGSGYHLDFNLLGLFGIISGIIGLPILCAATVRSVTHLNALCVYSRTYAPGEKPKLEKVIEQRVTAIAVHIIIGASVLMGVVLRQVPIAVLFGVFLYMGVASLNGIQFWDRILLLFTPVKHHPDVGYVRKVKTSKMHLYTIIQLIILALLWAVKSTKGSLGFPFLLILCIPLRKFILPFIFKKEELHQLDKDETTSGVVEEEEDS